MKLYTRVAALAAAVALVSLPATATANNASTRGQEKGNGPSYTPAPETPPPGASLPEKAKAYGVYCQGQSKKHVKGEKGTPFSQCVTAMAKAANNAGLSPGQSCKGMSKKHVKGAKGTPFSRCVKAVAKVRETL